MKKIFVFGSNLAGNHLAGAALEAYIEHGAVHGRGTGLQGNSYAIPTKNQYLRTLPIVMIERYIRDFIKFATEHPELEFKVTQIGCGYAGIEPIEIAPLFRGAPENCFFDLKWKEFLGVEKRKYWGTFNPKRGSSDNKNLARKTTD